MKLDIPGFVVTTSTGPRTADGVTVNVSLRMLRRTKWRLWLGTRLIRLAAWILPDVARRALAEQMFKDAS